MHTGAAAFKQTLSNKAKQLSLKVEVTFAGPVRKRN